MMDVFEKGQIVYFAAVAQDTFDQRIELEPCLQTFAEDDDVLKVGMDDKFLYIHWEHGTTDIVPLKHLICLSLDREDI